MRKLKLQMQMTLDGFIAGPNGELDWMTMDWDDRLKGYVNELTDSVGTILLGRKMTDGFINYWTNVIKNPADPEYAYAKKMVDYPKYVFTKSLKNHNWINSTLTGQNLIDDVNSIKQKAEKDIIVYGGASFVSSLINNNLIDEYHLFINPAVLSGGMTIFNKRKNLKRINSTAFDCGVVVIQYESV